MSGIRMTWDWVGDYPVFVYTDFIDHGVFNVRIVKGTKNDQNAGGTGPTAKPSFEYISKDIISVRDVGISARRIAGKLIERGEI